MKYKLQFVLASPIKDHQEYLLLEQLYRLYTVHKFLVLLYCLNS